MGWSIIMFSTFLSILSFIHNQLGPNYDPMFYDIMIYVYVILFIIFIIMIVSIVYYFVKKSKRKKSRVDSLDDISDDELDDDKEKYDGI